MPLSSRALALFLAASTLSHQNVSAAICEGGQDRDNVNMSCNSMVNTCTSSGLCVVATDGTCCAVFTGEAKSNCEPQVLADLTYSTECVNDGDTMGVSGGADGQMGGGDGLDWCSGDCVKAEFCFTIACVGFNPGTLQWEGGFEACNTVENGGSALDCAACYQEECPKVPIQAAGGGNGDGGDPQEGPMECLDGCDSAICDCMQLDDPTNECFELVGAACLDTTISNCLTTEESMEICPLVGCFLDAGDDEAKLAVCAGEVTGGGGDGSGGNGGDNMLECLDTCESTICDCLTSDEMSIECFKLVGAACLDNTISSCIPAEFSTMMCPLVGCIAEADGDEAKLAVCYGGGDLPPPTDGNLCAGCDAAGAGECFSPDGCAAMDKETMKWDGAGDFAGCNTGADQCAMCFSPCGGGDGGEDDMIECLDTCDSTICDCIQSEGKSQTDCFKLVGDACDNGNISTCLPTEVSTMMCPYVGCIAEAGADEAKLAACEGGYFSGGDLPPPTGACAVCAEAAACFSPGACATMDKETMKWEGLYDGCNGGADLCASCFPPCGGGDGTVDDNGTSGEEDMGKESTTMAPTGSPTNSPTMAPTGAPTKSPTKTTEDGAPTTSPIDDSGCGRVELVLGWVVLALATAMIH